MASDSEPPAALTGECPTVKPDAKSRNGRGCYSDGGNAADY